MEVKPKATGSGKENKVVSVSETVKNKIQKIKNEANEGPFKAKVSEGDVVSIAVENFLPKWKEELRQSRMNEEEEMEQAISESFKEYKAGGGDLDYKGFIRKEILPKFHSGRRRGGRTKTNKSAETL